MLLEIQKHINKAIEMVCKEDIWYVITDAYIPSGVEIIVHMQQLSYRDIFSMISVKQLLICISFLE